MTSYNKRYFISLHWCTFVIYIRHYKYILRINRGKNFIDATNNRTFKTKSLDSLCNKNILCMCKGTQVSVRLREEIGPKTKAKTALRLILLREGSDSSPGWHNPFLNSRGFLSKSLKSRSWHSRSRNPSPLSMLCNSPQRLLDFSRRVQDIEGKKGRNR